MFHVLTRNTFLCTALFWDLVRPSCSRLSDPLFEFMWNLVQKFSNKCGFLKDRPNDYLALLKGNKVYPCFSTNPVAVRHAASPLYAFGQCVISRNGAQWKAHLLRNANECISLVSTFIFRFGRFCSVSSAHNAVDRLWVAWQSGIGGGITFVTGSENTLGVFRKVWCHFECRERHDVVWV
jgi:hypothetical protein